MCVRAHARVVYVYCGLASFYLTWSYDHFFRKIHLHIPYILISMDVLASRENQHNAENRYRYTDNSRGARSAPIILVSIWKLKKGSYITEKIFVRKFPMLQK